MWAYVWNVSIFNQKINGETFVWHNIGDLTTLAKRYLLLIFCIWTDGNCR